MPSSELQFEAPKPTQQLPVLSKLLSVSDHMSSRGWASRPLTHSQVALKRIGRIGTYCVAPNVTLLP